ncbi:acyl-CoA dehydrogenase [Limimaricola sp. G21655-S1]|uniref:acyl-CoA dehydrogenase n=1 Tax=Limimaricola sp. G21655-S1 TaxID=3014768 RepID=UPI0022AECE7A|nr:acyl-CoA dehydrogenase [Limimaricola sp. G21655-S1]MCZ4262503.1 acyl-CoA dehydrogenase [Limimaricola sp. G21655-S1]
MPYQAPVDDFRFILEHVIGFSDVAATGRHAEMTPDVTDAILNEAGRMCDEILAPLNRAGDLEPARLENGVVRTSPGYAEGYRAIAEGGWVGMAAGQAHGGMGLPMALVTCVNEMMGGACLALQLNPLMTQAEIEALESHAGPDLQALYLPKLISGEWCGTMNLTEPQAGSDVGALRSKAEPNGDGTYRITGQKIYITWADNDFSDNIVHMVLARLPDAAEGTKGISLFLVPKFLPDADGRPGEANSLRVVSLEHKLGIHGSPTAVMEYDGATGWLVGEAHGGMAAMFTMMNTARLGVGSQAVGVAEAAMQAALAYAQERRQGKVGGTGTIIEHADVRAMLARMRAETFAARAITLACAKAIDLGREGDAAAKARAALLTPIAKAFGTETGINVADLGIQVHGGMGFIEETGAAQFLRDARITAIYEGTNGIQAMDLVGRKMMDGGEAAFALIDEVQTGAEAARDTLPDLAEPVWQAAEAMREATERLVGRPPAERFAGAMPYLRGFARLLGAHYHLRAAQAGEGRRRRLASFYVERMLPEQAAHLAALRAGPDCVMALDAEDLVA